MKTMHIFCLGFLIGWIVSSPVMLAILGYYGLVTIL